MHIPIRKPLLDLPDALDPVFIEGEPEESYLLLALSLLVPHLEPYLIRTMRRARPHVTDPDLLLDLDAFCGQEGQHFKLHEAFNAAAVRGGARGFEALERELAADYARFEATRPLRFNLAYAEGFEALTSSYALALEESDRSRWSGPANDLFTWHLVEELEHRTVAFEVYEHVIGRWPYRVAVAAFAQWHLVRFLLRATRAMYRNDGRLEWLHDGARGCRARMPRLYRMFARRILPRLARTYAPGYTPRDVPMPATLPALSAALTARSRLLGG